MYKNDFNEGNYIILYGSTYAVEGKHVRFVLGAITGVPETSSATQSVPDWNEKTGRPLTAFLAKGNLDPKLDWVNYENWYIRLKAVRAIGKTGGPIKIYDFDKNPPEYRDLILFPR